MFQAPEWTNTEGSPVTARFSDAKRCVSKATLEARLRFVYHEGPKSSYRSVGTSFEELPYWVGVTEALEQPRRTARLSSFTVRFPWRESEE